MRVLLKRAKCATSDANAACLGSRLLSLTHTHTQTNTNTHTQTPNQQLQLLAASMKRSLDAINA